jgi:ankyrin repeat protein
MGWFSKLFGDETKSNSAPRKTSSSPAASTAVSERSPLDTFFDAVHADDMDKIKSTLSRLGVHNINRQSDTFMGAPTALHEANTVQVAEYLIAQGADVRARDQEGKTPLHSARAVEIVECLLRHGADVNARSKVGYTALWLTIYRLFNHTPHEHYYETIKLLLRYGADPTIRDQYGESALSLAKAAAADGSNSRVLALLPH